MPIKQSQHDCSLIYMKGMTFRETAVDSGENKYLYFLTGNLPISGQSRPEYANSIAQLRTMVLPCLDQEISEDLKCMYYQPTAQGEKQYYCVGETLEAKISQGGKITYMNSQLLPIADD